MEEHQDAWENSDVGSKPATNDSTRALLIWKPKMCRLAWQLLGMLGNVLGRPRHASQRPRHALQRPRRPRHAFSQGPPNRRKTPPLAAL